ncbi:MAG: segregation/condensation protein A [Spirochaetia bacterium]|jgi:segregation and condensation protein A|nr:segregation/condensation protein A [Spirochaetia bacterium]
MEDVQSGKSAFKFKIDGVFEGPLDLLLNLIKTNEMNIYDIPITKITEQYLAYLALAVKINLENITEFYLEAATLLFIKSRMLLPIDDLSEEFEDPRKELVEKLIEYQRIKKLSDMIGEKERETEWIFERKNRQRTLPFADEDLWEEIEIGDLIKTFSAIIGSLSSSTKILELYEEVSVNEKLTLIQEYLETKKDFLFTDLLTRSNSLFDIICAFLAMLEAVKMKTIRVYQNTIFGDIRITATAAEGRQEEDSGNADGAG